MAGKTARHITSFQSYQEVGRQLLRFDFNRVETIIGGGCGVLGLSIVISELRAVFDVFAFFGLCPRIRFERFARSGAKILPLTEGVVGVAAEVETQAGMSRSFPCFFPPFVVWISSFSTRKIPGLLIPSSTPLWRGLYPGSHGTLSRFFYQQPAPVESRGI